MNAPEAIECLNNPMQLITGCYAEKALELIYSSQYQEAVDYLNGLPSGNDPACDISTVTRLIVLGQLKTENFGLYATFIVFAYGGTSKESTRPMRRLTT